jgi:hypothetical protein
MVRVGIDEIAKIEAAWFGKMPESLDPTSSATHCYT